MQALVRVTSIRSQNPRGFGGCIFAGRVIDESGSVADAARLIVVRAPAQAVGDVLVQPGQWWRVAGPSVQRQIDVNGFLVTETQIEADQAAIVRPSGEHLVTYIAESPDFIGIGSVKARRLWDTFGEQLYGILDSGDAAQLGTVVGEHAATTLVEAWSKLGDSSTVQWLQSENFDLRVAKKVMKFFGRETVQKLHEDPYRLLSFCGGWREVDQLAREKFKVALDDPRRLSGAVEEACYRLFSAGHTCALSSILMIHLRSIIGPQLVTRALNSGLTNGSFVIGHHGVQPLGAMVLERCVARAASDRLIEQHPLLQEAEIEALLNEYQAVEGISLNQEQLQAVHLACTHGFVVITGGAGVGKTTVLKALYKVMDAASVNVVQLALAGRAAKRMTEATARPASTIASFLRGSNEFSGEGTVVVVDEASMVDIITMSRLCEKLGSAARIVLVGDTAQLMPVGPGLVLHALARVPQVPCVALTTVKRYGSAIASAAQAIREGVWPSLPNDLSAPIAFVPAAVGKGFPDLVQPLYEMDAANTQILCARRNGPDGSKGLNAYCQQRMTEAAAPLRVWSEQHETYILTGLRLGDPVICTRNLWERGLQNGSLGKIVTIEEELRIVSVDTEAAVQRVLAWIEWDDGILRPLVEDMLDDIDLSYAITVHKAQGSQWQRVIVPISGHRLLDRTLIYTAITRAQRQVILVGNESAARAAVEAPPKAASRGVALDLTLRDMLGANPS